jgi:hypothetical protein
MQNAVIASKECIPNAPSAMDSSTFVPSLSGLDVSSVGVPTFGHETCILKGGKYCDICKLIKTLIGHSMCRWRLQNKIYCKVTYLTFEFWCRVQGTYNSMIRTSPRSLSHPSGRCSRRSRHIGPCEVDTISHQTLVKKGEPWLFGMCDASCASNDAIVMVHEVIWVFTIYIYTKIAIHFIFGKQGSVSFIM